jgi:hypothetical protein
MKASMKWAAKQPRLSGLPLRSSLAKAWPIGIGNGRAALHLVQLVHLEQLEQDHE